MLQEIQAIGICLICLSHLYFMKKCQTWTQGEVENPFDIGTVAADVQEILEDIADAVQGKPEPTPNQVVGGSIQEMLTTALLSKVMGQDGHGPQAERQISEETERDPSGILDEGGHQREESGVQLRDPSRHHLDPVQ